MTKKYHTIDSVSVIHEDLKGLVSKVAELLSLLEANPEDLPGVEINHQGYIEKAIVGGRKWASGGVEACTEKLQRAGRYHASETTPERPALKSKKKK